MARKQRFIVAFRNYNKATFLNMASEGVQGVTGNPDFEEAPVSAAEFSTAFNLMNDAAPNAVPNNIDGQRIFKPLREDVEDKMKKLGEFAQSTIGDNRDRMVASRLPLTKDPAQRPSDINTPVDRPKVEPGATSGKINVSAKPNKAADGILIEERQPDLSFREVARHKGFKMTINGYAENEVVVLQIRYWNNTGVGPGMQKPLAIVV